MLPVAIRKLSYNPIARTIAQRLHVGGVARRLYCRFLSPDGVLYFSCLGVAVFFQTNDSKQLGFVDCVVTTEKEIIQEIMGTLEPGQVFLDVGCNFGAYSIVASKLVGSSGRVIAVDPHPGTLEVLRRNLALNECNNVEVLDVAFGDQTGSLPLSFSEHGSHLQRVCDATSTVHSVRAIAGDEAISNFPKPAAVKIDVEGHEFAVLVGLERTLSNPVCRVLGVEIHPELLPRGVNADTIITLIRHYGFSSVCKNLRPSVMGRSFGGKELLVIARR